MTTTEFNSIMLDLLDAAAGHRDEQLGSRMNQAAEKLRPIVEAANADQQSKDADLAAKEQAAADAAVAAVRKQYAAEQAAAQAAKDKVAANAVK